MAYDALGNYVPDSSDDWSVPAPASPLKQQSVVAQAAPEKRPLDKATDLFKQVAIDYNPLMYLRTLREVPKVAFNATVSPLASMWSVPAQAIQNKGAEYLHQLAGDEQSAQEAAARNENIQPANFQLPLQTGSAQIAQEQLGKAFDESKLMGMIGMPKIPGRGFTPNDLRVVGANATRIGKQIAEIPTDIANARQGFTKIDPITGEGTIGAKVQPVVDMPVQAGMKAERALDPVVQDIMNRGGYSADILAAMAGQPMYAIKPKGGIYPRVELPETASSDAIDADNITRLVNDLKVVPDEPTVSDVNEAYSRNFIQNNNELRDQFIKFEREKQKQEFPGLNAGDRNTALTLKYSKPGARSQWERNMLNDFIATVNDPDRLPTMEEFANRVEKAHNWLEGPFVRNFTQYAGTAEDPLLALAAQGHTFRDPAALKELVQERALYTINPVREAYGFNPQGTLQEKLDPLETEYSKLYIDYQDRLNAQQDRYNELFSNGMADPYQDPQLAKFKAANEKIGKKVKTLDTQINNLKTGQAYETISDSSVRPMSAMDMWKSIRPEERQFYPNLERIKNDNPYQLVYSMDKANVNVSGIPVVGKKYIEDVLKGNIDPANTSIQAYIKRVSEKRIQSQEAEKAALQQQKDAGLRALRNQMTNTPGQEYDNAKAITIDNSLDPETIRKLLSAETEVLDHCVADIGGKPVDSKTLFKNEGIKRQRWPMYDLATGQLNRDDARPSSYMLGAERGNEKFISLRDVVTGMPEGLIQFTHPYTDPSTNQKTYTIGYVSGFQNRSIDPKYKNALKAMFNDHADEIRDIGSHAEDSGIYDKDHSNHHTLGIQRDQWEAVKDELPRFFTKEDLKAEIAKIQQVAAQQLLSADPVSLQYDVASAIETAISTAGAELEDRNLYREVDARLRQAYGEWAQQFPDNVFAQDPLRAVTHLQGRLDNMANSVPVALRGAFAEARDNVTAVLQGMQVPRQQVAQQPRRFDVGIDIGAMLSDVNTAMDNAITFAITDDPNMRESTATIIDSGMRRLIDEWRNEQSIGEFSTDPIMHLDRLMSRVEQSAVNFELSESIRDAYANLLDELRAVHDSYAPQAQAPAQQAPAQQAPAPARDRTLGLWLSDEMGRIAAADGLDASSGVWEVVGPTMRMYDIDTQPQQFANHLREAATLAQNALVEENLNALADHIREEVNNRAAPQAPARFDVGPIIMAAREAAQRDLTPDQWNTMVSLLEHANNIADARQQPQGFADALNTIVSSNEGRYGFSEPMLRRLTGLVDNITNAFNAHNQNLGAPDDLGAWEVDDQHGANQDTPTSVARRLVEIEREPDNTLRPAGITSTLQALRTGQLDHPSLAEHPPGSPERIAAGMRIAPIVESMAAQDFSYNDLQQFLSNEERNQINTDSSRIVRQAQSHGVDANETGSMIRSRNDIYGGATVNLDNYSLFALEVLRRDVVDSLNAAPQAAAPQAPAVGRPFHVTEDNRNDAAGIIDTITDSMDDGGLSMYERIDEFDGYLDMLARGVEGLEDIVPQPYEEWNNPEGLRFELMRRFQQERDALQQMIEEEDDDEEPQQFAKGGRVTHTPTVDSMRYELMMRRA